MLRLLAERAKAGVDIRMFGKLGKGASGIDARKLPDLRLHVRAIIRDGSAAFIGSQSLRKLELDGAPRNRRHHFGRADRQEDARRLRGRLGADAGGEAGGRKRTRRRRKRRRARRLLPARDAPAVEHLALPRDRVERQLVAVDFRDEKRLILIVACRGQPGALCRYFPSAAARPIRTRSRRFPSAVWSARRSDRAP